MFLCEGIPMWSAIPAQTPTKSEVYRRKNFNNRNLSLNMTARCEGSVIWLTLLVVNWSGFWNRRVLWPCRVSTKNSKYSWEDQMSFANCKYEIFHKYLAKKMAILFPLKDQCTAIQSWGANSRWRRLEFHYHVRGRQKIFLIRYIWSVNDSLTYLKPFFVSGGKLFLKDQS